MFTTVFDTLAGNANRTYIVFINLVTPKARAKHEPFVQQTGLCPLPNTATMPVSSFFSKSDKRLSFGYSIDITEEACINLYLLSFNLIIRCRFV
jgi:hypothetical protein